MAPDKLAYTIPEAVKASGFTRTRLYEMHAAGQLPMKKAGRRTIIRAVDLDAAIEALPDLPRRAA